MPERPDHVVISYEQFIECRNRRLRLAAAQVLPPPTTDADLPPAPREPRLPEAAVRRPK